MSAEIEIRDMRPDERPYILDSFLRSYGKTRYGKGIHPDVLIGAMETLLVYWNCYVAVVGNTILGWIVFKDAETAAWAYVRHQFRRKGIFKALAAACDLGPFVKCAFYDRTYASYLHRHLEFHPYLPFDVAKRAEEALIGKTNT